MVNSPKNDELVQKGFDRLVNRMKEEVGYKKPPKSGQFKKGCSGNPKGRKPKTQPKSILEALELSLIKPIKIQNEKGHQETVCLFEVLVKQMIQDALRKDCPSRKLIFELLLKFDLVGNCKHIEEKVLKTMEEEKEDLAVRQVLLEKLKMLIDEREMLEEHENGGINPC